MVATKLHTSHTVFDGSGWNFLTNRLIIVHIKAEKPIFDFRENNFLWFFKHFKVPLLGNGGVHSNGFHLHTTRSWYEPTHQLFLHLFYAELTCWKGGILLTVSRWKSLSSSVRPILLPMFVYGDCMAVCLILYTCQQWVWLKQVWRRRWFMSNVHGSSV